MQRQKRRYNYQLDSPQPRRIIESEPEPAPVSVTAPPPPPSSPLEPRSKWSKDDIMKVMLVAGGGLLFVFLVDTIVRLAYAAAKSGGVDPAKVVIIDGRKYIPI